MDVQCGEYRCCLLVVVMALLAVQTVHSSQPADSRSCMEEWMVNIGISQESARTYVNKTEFYSTQGLDVEGLLYVHHASLLRRLGINRSRHRDLILSCSHNPGSCPPDPCFNAGRCRYSGHAEHFVCVCARSWEGRRCDEKVGGRLTKADMRVLLKQHQQREAWLQRVLNATHARCDEQADKYLAIVRAQDEELRVLRSKIETKGAREARRRTKLKVARERATNATRERNACNGDLTIARQANEMLQRQVAVCRSQLGFSSVNARGCGNRRDGKDGLATRGVLQQGDLMKSPHTKLSLTVLPNGTVAAYDQQGSVFWSSPDVVHSCQGGRGPYRLVVMPSGDVQAQDNEGCALWRTGTGGDGDERSVCLQLEDTRRLALYAPCGQLIWSSGPGMNSTT